MQVQPEKPHVREGRRAGRSGALGRVLSGQVFVPGECHSLDLLIGEWLTSSLEELGEIREDGLVGVVSFHGERSEGHATADAGA